MCAVADMTGLGLRCAYPTPYPSHGGFTVVWEVLRLGVRFSDAGQAQRWG